MSWPWSPEALALALLAHTLLSLTAIAWTARRHPTHRGDPE